MWRIALKNLLSHKRRLIGTASAVVLGVAFFLAVSSLMSGSESDFLKRLVDNSPHITISDEFRKPAPQPAAMRWPEAAVAIRHVKPLAETRGIRGYRQKLSFVESLPGVRAAPTLTGSAVLTFAGREHGVTITGIVPAKMKHVSTIEEKMVAGTIAVEGIRTLGGIVGITDAATAPDRVVILAAVVAFGFLGLVDDLLGDGGDRGLKGHVRAALTGRVTTGFVKLGGGAAVALVLVGALLGDHPDRVLVDGALVALAANLGNLFDRAPGRTIKVGVLAWLPIAVVAGTSAAGVASAVVIGGALALLPADLGERSMLGDTGANALGAALGVAAVATFAPATRDVVVGVLLVLTLLSEVVSFSRVIAAVAPLRLIDRLGRRREDAPS